MGRLHGPSLPTDHGLEPHPPCPPPASPCSAHLSGSTWSFPSCSWSLCLSFLTSRAPGTHAYQPRGDLAPSFRHSGGSASASCWSLSTSSSPSTGRPFTSRISSPCCSPARAAEPPGVTWRRVRAQGTLSGPGRQRRPVPLEGRPVSVHHLGDGEARPAGHVAEAEAIAAPRPGVQAAPAGATRGTRQGCVCTWGVLGLSPGGRAGALGRGGGLCAFQEEQRGQAHLEETERTDPLLPPPAPLRAWPLRPWPLRPWPASGRTILKKRSASGSTTVRATREP